MMRYRQATIPRSSGMPRRGVSLLEMILSLAILAGAVVILGELVRIGPRDENEPVWKLIRQDDTEIVLVHEAADAVTVKI